MTTPAAMNTPNQILLSRKLRGLDWSEPSRSGVSVGLELDSVVFTETDRSPQKRITGQSDLYGNRALLV
jgi:hypothetical protein